VGFPPIHAFLFYIVLFTEYEHSAHTDTNDMPTFVSFVVLGSYTDIEHLLARWSRRDVIMVSPPNPNAFERN